MFNYLKLPVSTTEGYADIIKKAFPKYGESIIDTINDLYADNYYILASYLYECDDDTALSRFNSQVKALCRRYPKLEEAQAFFEARKIDGLATAPTLQTTIESKSENKTEYNGGETTTDTFNPINTATSRTSSKTARDFNERNDASKGKTATTTKTTGATADGRSWELALSEGLAAQSPVNEFVSTFAGLLLMPPWEVD